MTNIIRIHRPELTTEERARRMNQIKKAATQLVVAYEKTKGQGENKEVNV